MYDPICIGDANSPKSDEIGRAMAVLQDLLGSFNPHVFGVALSDRKNAFWSGIRRLCTIDKTLVGFNLGGDWSNDGPCSGPLQLAIRPAQRVVLPGA